MFLWCLQLPLVASFVDLQRADLLAQDPETFVGEGEGDWRHAFTMVPQAFSYSTGAEYQGHVSVEVLGDAVLLAGGFVVSHG